MASTAQNTPFIKQFASSDKRIRDKALDSLRTFLSGRSSIEEIELLKLWKGLFYCMWMSDKPLVQQRLAVDLASLVDTLRPDVVLPFLDAFWKILAREWGNIDALRMNKFLYLIRQYLFASFRYLSRHSWANTTAITGCMDVLAATPLNPTDPKIPNGMRYHVLDIYVDELDRVDADREGKMPLEALLAPVRALDMESKTKAVRKSAREVLTDERLKDWNKVEEGADEESSGGAAVGAEEDDGEWGGIDD